MTEREELLREIDALITARLVAFYDALVARGQIARVEQEGPMVSRYTESNALLSGLVPRRDERPSQH